MDNIKRHPSIKPISHTLRISILYFCMNLMPNMGILKALLLCTIPTSESFDDLLTCNYYQQVLLLFGEGITSATHQCWRSNNTIVYLTVVATTSCQAAYFTQHVASMIPYYDTSLTITTCHMFITDNSLHSLYVRH